MWWAEHAIMGVAAACLALHLLRGRNYSWLLAVFISQLPWWAGAIAFVLSGVAEPGQINLLFNVFVAGLFAMIGLRLQSKGAKGNIHIKLCILFLAASCLDVVQVVGTVPWYVYIQEAIHYLALATIGGRAYVRRFDSINRSLRDSARLEHGGRLL